jgi:Na+/H+-dicarboxylate symporter
MSKLTRYLIAAIVLGTIAGLALGARVEPLGELGTLVIRVLKALATPLLFFGIVDTFCKTRIALGDGLKLLAISTVNALVALVIAVSIAHVLPVERLLNLAELQTKLPKAHFVPVVLDSSKILGSLNPANGVISVVLLAILVGTLIRATPLERHPKISAKLSDFFSGGYLIINRILHWVIKIMPLAIFCVVAKIVGTSGLAFLPTLGVFILAVSTGMLLQAGIYYGALLRLAGYNPFVFFREGSEALLTAFSTGSSLAALPVTLDVLQFRRKIPPRYARLASAIGTNLNHDGIILYEAMAALFIARLYGIPLTIPEQAVICGTSVIAAIGIAGVPDAGLITLSLVLGAAHLPLEAVGLLLPIDWLIGRMRATVNVASDMTVAHLLAPRA